MHYALGLGIRGPSLGFIFWFGLGLGHTMVCDVTLTCTQNIAQRRKVLIANIVILSTPIIELA